MAQIGEHNVQLRTRILNQNSNIKWNVKPEISLHNFSFITKQKWVGSSMRTESRAKHVVE